MNACHCGPDGTPIPRAPRPAEANASGNASAPASVSTSATANASASEHSRLLDNGPTCHSGAPTVMDTGHHHIALVGHPNVGKSTLFNALTGLKVKVANYAGVTVTRTVGTVETPTGKVTIEDLPGTYSLDPISPDEQIAVDILNDRGPVPTDAVIVVIDATNLECGVNLVAAVEELDKPTIVMLNFVDDLLRRGGHVDVAALERALGVPILALDPRHARNVEPLRRRLAEPEEWTRPAVLPPTDSDERDGWVASVVAAAGFRAPRCDERSRRIDDVLLHPVFGTIFFFAFMLAFFEIIFAVAAPIQDWIESLFGYLGEAVTALPAPDWLISLLADGIIGGVGGVLVFIPQIALLFLMISLMEKSGYMARAAFLMDKVMATIGLEGRAFVAMLSSLACAIPGIMATRSLPNARDRLATMMTTPLMTCSARLPVYTLLISAFVPRSYQGLTMFGMYLLGAVATMLSAKVFTLINKGATALPFYMHMPPYRMPTWREILIDIAQACGGFLRRVGGIILVLSLVLWVVLNLPTGEFETSYAAWLGHAIQPIFDPLGFDWRVTLGLITAMGAREMFVGTMAQVAPDLTLAPDAVGALLVYFALAMQCISTLAVLRKESGTWRWPVIAFVYMTVLAWVAAFIVKLIIP